MKPTLLVAVALAGLLAAPVRAAEEAAVLRQRAEQLAAQDRCAEALPRARRARELAPGDARAALVEGRCALRTGDYAGAVEPLEAARRLDPSLDGVTTDLGQVHYHLGRLDRAQEELARALERDPDDARALLYRGLVLLRRAENEEAARTLDRASRLDEQMSPAAAYYAGLAWEHAQERDRAVAALRRARDADPDGPWGEEADRALERVGESFRRHWWARVRGGLEHDSNPALRIPGSASAENVEVFGGFEFGERGDLRGVFDGELGAELLRSPEWSAGAIAGYQGNAYTDLHEFDLQYPWLALWLDHRIAEKTWMRLQPFGGYQWLETDPFVAHGGVQLSVDHELGDALLGRVFGRYGYNDFLYRVSGSPVLLVFDTVVGSGFDALARGRRDRDGSEVDAGAELELDVDATATTLRGGAAYERYESDGEDWRRDGVRGWVGAEQELPLELDLDLFASFAHRPYEHVSSFTRAPFLVAGGGTKRIDNVWELAGSLERPLGEHVTVGVRAAYTDHESNTTVFDYDRWIAGGYVVLTWGD